MWVWKTANEQRDMSFSGTRSCPDCGATRRRRVQGGPGGFWRYECLHCGREYSDGVNPLGPEEKVQALRLSLNGENVNLPQLDVNKWLRRLTLFTAAGAVALGLGMWASQYFKLGAAPVAQKSIPMLGSTMYEGAGKQHFIRVFLQQESGPLVLQSVVDDFESGRRLAAPQQFSFDTRDKVGDKLGAKPDWAQFRQHSDGNLYMVLQNRQFLVFNPQVHQFSDMSEGLKQLFPKELGAGIDYLEFQSDEWPDALRVQSGGQFFYVNWLARVIAPQERVAEVFAKAARSYHQVWQGYAFRPNGEGEPGSTYLLSFLGKTGDGQMRHLPPVVVYSLETAMESGISAYQPIGNGLALKTADAQSPGLIAVQPLPPMKALQGGRVLAANDSRVLVTFDSREAGGRGAVLQMLGSTGQLVWSEKLSAMPLIKGDMQLQASATRNGFYLRNGYAEPALMMDNEGKVVYEFKQGDGSAGGSGLNALKALFD